MFILYALTGIAGGILGGMGMGGGTILIPLMSILFEMNQHTAQAINLVGFIPMAIIALVIHIKNNLVDFKNVLWIIIPGVLAGVLGVLIANNIDGDLLKRFFGGFLIILSVVQFLSELKNKK